jgi:hypothetical protein
MFSGAKRSSLPAIQHFCELCFFGNKLERFNSLQCPTTIPTQARYIGYTPLSISERYKGDYTKDKGDYTKDKGH